MPCFIVLENITALSIAKKPDISFIGSGNVATHLGSAFKEAGCNIHQVYSRQPPNAKDLAERLGAEVANTPGEIKETDLLIMAVSDDVIDKLVPELKLKKTLVVHTSGSVTMEVLNGVSSRFGVMYPLQTFSKARPLNIAEIPFLLEANNDDAYHNLHTITSLIARDIRKVSSADRLKYHLSAVIANNFTNYLLSEAQQYLERNELDFEVLHPLIRETVDKALILGPDQSQTGPAKRNDRGTIRRHLEMLEGDELKKMYVFLSDYIGRK